MIVAAASMLGDFARPYLKWASTQRVARSRRHDGLVAVGGSRRIGEIGAIAVAPSSGASRLSFSISASPRLTVYLRGTTRPWDTARTSLPVALPRSRFTRRSSRYSHRVPRGLALDTRRCSSCRRSQLNALRALPRAATPHGRTLIGNGSSSSANLSFAAALVATLDARDRYTAGHSAAVASTRATSQSAWVCRARNSRTRISAGLFTTSERSDFPPGLLEKEVR